MNSPPRASKDYRYKTAKKRGRTQMAAKQTNKETLRKKLKCAIGIFCIGGIAYNLIEILWRGYTHWSMFIVGGACFQIMGRIHTGLTKLCTFNRCVLCSLAVTGMEFLSGCLFNLKLKMNVWDYSEMAFNIKGQVCLLYTVLWGGLSIIALPIYRFCIDKLENGLKRREKKKLPQE